MQKYVETVNADITFSYEDFNPRERNDYDIYLLAKYIEDYVGADKVEINSINIEVAE